MATIIPRWEWRTFGTRFGVAEARFAAMTPGAVQESDELYLLSGEGDNVKVRDDLMDIKVFRETSPDGLERWEPVMKAGFPLPAADVGRVLVALRIPVPPLGRERYTLDQFVDELARPAGVRPVAVHKRRVRYTVGGCTSEVSDVVADGLATRTIAIESEDAAAVVAAVHSVGLADYLNTSYPKGLAALLGGAPDRYAVIDVGTNSVKFHVGERDRAGGWRAVVDRADITRLGEGLAEHGEIAPAALERTADAVAGMAAEARREGARAIAAVGTAGLRIARNGGAVVAAIRARTGVAVEVIPGEEESRLAFLAAASGLGLGDEPLVVFDTGGGSTQFTFGQGGRVDERFSLEVGAVRYTERFGLADAVSPEVLREAMAAISADLARLDGRPAPEAVAAMGGAVTNMAAVMHHMATYDPDVVQGSVLDQAEIDRQIELYRTLDAAGRRSIVGLQPKRADVILAGACIVRTVMREARQGVLQRERPGPAPRTARRTVRRLTRRRQPTPRPANSRSTAMTNEESSDGPRLSGPELGRLLKLIKGADSVELKLTVPASDQVATIRRLPLDPVEAQPRQVFFFDTPDLALNAVGVVVRARRIQGGRADTVVKLRPVDPGELSPELRQDPAFKVEVDALPGGFVCSGSLKGRTTGEDVRATIGGLVPNRKIFTRDQRAFYAAHAPAGLELDALVPLGPTFILKAVFTPKALGRPLVGEMWLYQDGSRILELSTKCRPAEAFQVAAEVRAYLAERGVPLTGEQQTKTKTALEFFARQRQAEAAGA